MFPLLKWIAYPVVLKLSSKKLNSTGPVNPGFKGYAAQRSEIYGTDVIMIQPLSIH